MSDFRLQTTQIIQRPLSEVFDFFSNARNLETITPPWLRFEVLTKGEIPMEPGTLIDYRIRLHGIPLRWQSEITAFEPMHRFVDEQRRGPYRYWIHEHRFETRNGTTVVTDDVRYAIPGGALVNRLFIRKDLTRIFSHRHQALDRIFHDDDAPVDAHPQINFS